MKKFVITYAFLGCIFFCPHVFAVYQIIDLGTLGGTTSLAYSISDSDKIVGWANNSSGQALACLFDQANSNNNKNLGTLSGYTSSTAYAINDNDQIVGNVWNGSSVYHACLFDKTGNGNNTDLNSLINPSSGWILRYAYDINNNGWIVGTGSLGGYEHAYLLVIPEPATICILGLGALSLVRRKK